MVVITDIEENQFRIGHSIAKSETFLPHYMYDKDLKMICIDVAGFHDTRGDLIDLVNCLIMR